MKKQLFLTVLILPFLSCSQDDKVVKTMEDSDDFLIQNTTVTWDRELDHLVFSIFVDGTAGGTLPTPAGQLDGAPVLGYVFPTTLKPTDVGFSDAEGIVAMALTSHPDFDDTPLWDENNDSDYANDGVIWHAHWVVLVPNNSVEGGLAVRQFDPENDNVTLPPTNPGMPMFMDSPGFNVVTKVNRISVVIPLYRMNGKTDFNFDAVTAYMQVNTSNDALPLLGVYEVYSVASGDLSLPYSVN